MKSIVGFVIAVAMAIILVGRTVRLNMGENIKRLIFFLIAIMLSMRGFELSLLYEFNIAWLMLISAIAVGIYALFIFKQSNMIVRRIGALILFLWSVYCGYQLTQVQDYLSASMIGLWMLIWMIESVKSVIVARTVREPQT